jgi:DNA-directed RNA polymerase subunit E'/Rpb7
MLVKVIMNPYSLDIITEKVSLKSYDLRETNNINTLVKNYVLSKFESSVSPSGLYVIKVLDINKDQDSNNGLINDLTADIVYNIMFSAFVFNPVIGTTFDIRVTKCTEVGLWGIPIALDVVPSKSVSIECMSSPDLVGGRHYTSSSQSYVNEKGRSPIKVGSVVKFKVLNKQVEYRRMLIFGLVEN